MQPISSSGPRVAVHARQWLDENSRDLMSTGSDWLLTVAQRLARAREIGEEIEDAVKSYTGSDATEIEQTIRDDGVTNLVLRIHRPPPARLALLVGEGVHQLRAALDNLVVALADQAAGFTLPTEEVTNFQFPIADTAEKFEAQAKRHLKGLHEDVVRRIEEVQPYHLLDYVFGDPQPIPLWYENLHCLRELSNHDKHRRINVLLHRTDHLAVLHSSDVTPTTELTTDEVHDGDVIATVEARNVARIDATTELAVAHPTADRPLRLRSLPNGQLLWTIEALVIPHITGELDLVGNPTMRRVSLD
jgi:hypothetical protein